MNEVKQIAVVGLGYVGLPLALQAEKKGFGVIGIEVDQAKLKNLRARKPIIYDGIANKQLAKTKINFTDNFTTVKTVDAVIICVPTPVDGKKMPDLTLVKNAVASAANHMKPGSLLIVESTINPGVCDEVVIPLIENKTKHKVGKTLYVAHCPERINPGDPSWHVSNINRVMGADSDQGLKLAYGFYSKLINADVKKMGSLKEAEAVKIVENSFRDVNIAFVNELAMSFAALGINVKNVIDGAATKPFAFMPHYPGIGVGGHCIPVDPYYLIEYARGRGFNHKFLSLARSINEGMPSYSIKMLSQTLKMRGKKLKGAKVVILGISYKPNVADDRESPSYKIINQLKKRGATTTTFDPHMPDKSTVKTLTQALSNQDAAILVTAHTDFMSIDPAKLKGMSAFLDGRNALQDKQNKFSNAKISYLGIGG